MVDQMEIWSNLQVVVTVCMVKLDLWRMAGPLIAYDSHPGTGTKELYRIRIMEICGNQNQQTWLRILIIAPRHLVILQPSWAQRQVLFLPELYLLLEALQFKFHLLKILRRTVTIYCEFQTMLINLCKFWSRKKNI